MRLLAMATVALAGCESCDFSFGPIPLEVTVTPADVDATVVICDWEYGEDLCQTLGVGGDTGTGPTYGATVPAGTYSSAVSWDGYATCRYPALEIDVTAPGCDAEHVSVDRQRPTDDGVLRVPVRLECGS